MKPRKLQLRWNHESLNSYCIRKLYFCRFMHQQLYTTNHQHTDTSAGFKYGGGPREESLTGHNGEEPTVSSSLCSSR